MQVEPGWECTRTSPSQCWHAGDRPPGVPVDPHSGDEPSGGGAPPSGGGSRRKAGKVVAIVISCLVAVGVGEWREQGGDRLDAAACGIRMYQGRQAVACACETGRTEHPALSATLRPACPWPAVGAAVLGRQSIYSQFPQVEAAVASVQRRLRRGRGGYDYSGEMSLEDALEFESMSPAPGRGPYSTLPEGLAPASPPRR